MILGTCEVCFKVFLKPTGVPSLGSLGWVCSDNCKSKIKPILTQDEVLEVNLESNLRIKDEIDYQTSIHKQGEDVDLDFNYKYN